ncbi:DMT family transporter [Sabulicella rubraurantiaca]|uniref:DMT family transporter n=1 Tax=Sabulicella rubraurantiaca TaxID=2811429 RepID=UPI001A9611E2|nr:DMT family transporter [Sabulicella rubraurantiaca]
MPVSGMVLAPKLLLGLLLGAAASVIWGGHAVVARLALTGQGITVLDMMFCRYLPAALILAPLAWRERRALAELGLRRLLLLTLFGGCFNLLLFVSALRFAPSSHGGTIAPMTGPVVGALAAWWLLNERPTAGRLAALAAMVTGVLLIGWDGLGGHPGAWRGDLLLVGAGGTWGVFTVLLRRWRVAAIPASAAVTLTSLPFVLPPFLLFRAEPFFSLDWRLWGWMLLAQGVALGAVSMLLFARSVEMLGATRAATLSVLVPATGLTTSYLVLGEPIGWVKAGGAALAVGAMLVAVLFTGRRA